MSASLESLAAQLVLGLHKEEAHDRYPKKLLEGVAASLASLSKKYVERTSKRPHLTSHEVHAYALYYLAVNAEKVLYHLNLFPELTTLDDLRVLDFGCGPGTASLALASHSRSSLQVDLADTSSLMTDTAKNLFTLMNRNNTQVRTVPFTLDGLHDPYDLIFACNVFNEVEEEGHLPLLLKLLSLRSKTGALLIIEPGSFESTRALMRLREKITDTISVLHPCTHQNPCPLLKDEDQWCHNSLFFERSNLIRQIDELTGFNKHRIKFSSLLLGEASPSRGFRVITDPQKNKIGSEAIVCGEDYFGLVQLPKRYRNDGNRSFEKAHQHALVTITPPPHAGIIEKEMVVELQKPVKHSLSS